MNRIMIDLETLGTNVDSQIVSIGACRFNIFGAILAEFHAHVALERDSHINATAGTIAFWLQQAADNPAAVSTTFNNPSAVALDVALKRLSKFCREHEVEEVWANGTKFDLGMLEYQYNLLSLPLPWRHNADCCMRTLRKLTPDVEVSYEGIAHNALCDAIWQAKFVAGSLTQLGVTY